MVDLEQVYQELQRGVPAHPRSEFSAEVNARLQDLMETPPMGASGPAVDEAKRRVAAMVAQSVRQMEQPKRPSAQRRVTWLRSMSDILAASVIEETACKAGCSHCCHIPVVISRTEALAISQELGLTLNDKARDYDSQSPDLSGKACSFLSDGRCQIYTQRPVACRVHLNMDRDDLLCRLTEGHAIPVPYFNAIEVKVAYGALVDRHRLCDVREWFPNGLKRRDMQ